MKVMFAGIKDISLIDVCGEPSLTVWFCGCNLKCPYCHNWRIAEAHASTCYPAELSEIYTAIESASSIVDYIHVTGGEPTQQAVQLQRVLEFAKSVGVRTSVNTNCSNPSIIESLLRRGLIDHLATDVKAPPDFMIGLPRSEALRYWRGFTNTLRLIREYDVILELRIPVLKYGAMSPELVASSKRYLVKALSIVETVSKVHLVLNPILGPPIIDSVRNPEWCSKYAVPGIRDIELAETLVKSLYSRADIRLAQHASLLPLGT
ncbi:MAG: anaerobic ribonucleoside-triphosphate reductase activating protein [Desulfurococcales archaeon ex4484_204]|nr:MAG: anaerobic ribonucleoside-triphosphate reductase activating protein [Desulfurococcales archaeon ex4484_204]